MTRSSSASRTNERIEQTASCRFCQVSTELGQKRRFFRLGHGGLLVQLLYDVLSHGVDTKSTRSENTRRDGLFLPQESQQDVLGADVIVHHPVRFFGGVGQNTFRFGRQRNLDGSGNLIANDNSTFDFFSNGFQGKTGLSENAAGEPFAFSHQAEQQMLSLDRATAQLGRLVSGEEDYALRSFGISLEHDLHPKMLNPL